jgi:DNA-directed RNA polymerase I subunit RPA2
MPPSASATQTDTEWGVGFDTLRRDHLFRNPPKDRSAYPALQAAIAPHVESFNELFRDGGLISHALKDIGTVTYLDGDPRLPLDGKNKLEIKFKEIYVEKSRLPDSNKFSTKNREILPAECRERHVTYRGSMSARLEFRINDGDPVEFVREIGKLPLMVMVGILSSAGRLIANRIQVE